MNFHLGADDDGDWFCIEGTRTVRLCLNPSLVDAFLAIENEVIEQGEDEPYVLKELVEDALVKFLREFGRLPKPYV